MPAGKDMKATLRQASNLRKQRDEVKAQTARRAAIDVLDGSMTCEEAARNRGVTVVAVRKALAEIQAEQAKKP